MTEEQKFLFDAKGWLLLPAVLSEEEIHAVKAHLAEGGNGFTIRPYQEGSNRYYGPNNRAL